MIAPNIDSPKPLRVPHTDKEPPSELKNALSKSAVTLSDMDWVLSGLCGTQARLGLLGPGMGPKPDISICNFYFLFFLLRQSGPFPKDSGFKPMNFQFWWGVPWGPVRVGVHGWRNRGDREGPSPPGPSHFISWMGPGRFNFYENGPFLILLDCFSAIAIVV